MSWFRRRPNAASLAALYDAGAKAAREGGKNPYEPPQQPGDATRSQLWTYGLEDETEFMEMEKLT